MGQRTTYVPGTFSWVDLQTGDQDGAKRFYAELLGWRYEDMPMGDGMAYSMASVDGQAVAAIAPLMGDGVPPHWNCYVTVTDADAIAARAHELGGTTLGDAFDVFDAGRMAIVQDPQGAIVSAWQPRERSGAGLVNAVGALSWNDLITPDPEASRRFYSALFGWTVESTPMAEGQYWTIFNQGRLNGGIAPAQPGQHPAWNLYFGIEDVDGALAQVGELGGGTIVEPMDVPSGRFAIAHDPAGAVFSIVAGEFDD